jgi:hypothetical protein
VAQNRSGCFNPVLWGTELLKLDKLTDSGDERSEMDEIPGRGGRPGVRAGPALAAGLALSDITVSELWGRCIALGGSLSLSELREYLSGDSTWTIQAHNLAALALNEYFADRGLGPLVAYSFDL